MFDTHKTWYTKFEMFGILYWIPISDRVAKLLGSVRPLFYGTLDEALESERQSFLIN